MTSPALERAYASATVNDVPIHTLEIVNDVFATPYRFAQSYQDVTVRLETDEYVTFLASGIGLSLPQRGITGRQDLTFQLDNVTGQASSAIKAAMAGGGLTRVIYRAYLTSDLTAPQNSPVELVAMAVSINIKSVIVTATFRDFVNKAWPRQRYTLDITPGLRYVNG